MTEKQEFLTQSEAIEQGYRSCGIKDKEFQHLHEISELTAEDFLLHDYLVADKNPVSPGIDGGSIKDMVTDYIMDNNEFDDDTNTIPQAIIKAVNWDEIAEKVNSEIQKHPYYYLTKINLVPDKQ